MKPGLGQHRKINRLVALTGMSRPAALGTMYLLWDATAREKDDGILSGWTHEDIAGIVDWARDANEIVSALKTAKWLDESPNGTLLIHDWPEEAPRYVQQRWARNLKKPNDLAGAVSFVRAKHDAVLRTPTDADGRHQTPTDASVLYGTELNGNSQQPSRPSGSNAEAPKSEPLDYSAKFLAAFEVFPDPLKRSGKKASFALWQKLGLDAHAENVMAWIRACSSSPDWQKDGGQFVPGMQVWLKKHDFSEPPAVPSEAQDEAPRKQPRCPECNHLDFNHQPGACLFAGGGQCDCQGAA